MANKKTVKKTAKQKAAKAAPTTVAGAQLVSGMDGYDPKAPPTFEHPLVSGMDGFKG